MVWNLDPVAFSLFGLSVRWYGLAYVAGFFIVDSLGKYLARRMGIMEQVAGNRLQDASDKKVKREKLKEKREIKINRKYSTSHLEPRTSNKAINSPLLTTSAWDSLLLGAFICGIIGGRLGEFIFFSPEILINNPLQVLKIWHGGMSIHGGLIGAVGFIAWFCHKRNIRLLSILNIVALPMAIALGLGRIANFINGELVGIPTNQNWGIIFPHVDNLLRHPTQLYESAAMFVLAGVLWMVVKRGFVVAPLRKGEASDLSEKTEAGGFINTSPLAGGTKGGSYNNKNSKILNQVQDDVNTPIPFTKHPAATFCVLYGLFRFIVEFYKDYPASILGLKMGQILCLVMIAIGVIIIISPFSKGGRQGDF